MKEHEGGLRGVQSESQSGGSAPVLTAQMKRRAEIARRVFQPAPHPVDDGVTDPDYFDEDHMATNDPESFREQLSRVEMMAEGSETWDLSDNDIAALTAVLADRERLLNDWREQDEALQAIWAEVEWMVDGASPDGPAMIATYAKEAIAKREPSMVDKRVKAASDACDAAAIRLVAVVQKVYPIGTVVMVRLGLADVEGVVEGYGQWYSRPGYLSIRNVRTDKVRSFHPTDHADIVIVKRVSPREAVA